MNLNKKEKIINCQLNVLKHMIKAGGAIAEKFLILYVLPQHYI